MRKYFFLSGGGGVIVFASEISSHAINEMIIILDRPNALLKRNVLITHPKTQAVSAFCCIPWFTSGLSARAFLARNPKRCLTLKSNKNCVLKTRVSERAFSTLNQNCLQWGQSNLADPVESPKIRSLNWDFGNILSIFPKKNSKTQSSLNFLQSGSRRFTKSDFSGLAPIQ